MKTKKITAALLSLMLVTGTTACTPVPVDTNVNVISEITAAPVSEEASEEISTEETVAAETQESADISEEISSEPSNETSDPGVCKLYPCNEEFEIDLNSDGVMERILYTIKEGEDFDSAELTVEDKFHLIDMPIESFLICDIDTSDNFLEIGVSSTGWSSDYATDFLRYDNGELYYLGCVGDSVDGAAEFNFSLVDSFGKPLTVNGDGTVTAAKRLSIFQSWYANSTYKLNNDILEEVQDMYYPYGEELKDDFNGVSSKIYDENWPASYTSKDINLYTKPDTSSETVAFAAQKFAATATDNKNWVYLTGEDGTSGWLYYENNNTYDDFGNIAEFGNNAYIDAVTGERFIDGFNEEGTYYAEIFCGLLMYD